MRITPDSALYYFVLLLVFGNLFAFAIGIIMLAAPRYLKALFKFSNRWISTRQMTKPLEKPRPADHILLRYPRVFGGILLASAALILIKGTILVTGMSAADGGKLLSEIYNDADISSSVWESLWISLIAFIVLGTLTAIGVGLMSLFRVGQLMHWAQDANRWISTRKMTKPLDMPHYHLDELILAQPRLWGGAITALALFSALVLWWFVLGV